MPLRYFKCPVCKKERGTLRKKTPECNHGQDGEDAPVSEMKQIIIAPNQKFMVCANKATGRSKIKDLKGQLTERARNHGRDILLDDNIQLNIDNELGVANNFLNEKGERRKKIDDI